MKRLFDAVPADSKAEERAWDVVRAAFAAREPDRRRRRGPVVVLVAAAGIAAVVAAALSPPGQAVVNAVRRSIGIEGARPALFRLPAPGRLLVSGAGGTVTTGISTRTFRLTVLGPRYSLIAFDDVAPASSTIVAVGAKEAMAMMGYPVVR